MCVMSVGAFASESIPRTNESIVINGSENSKMFVAYPGQSGYLISSCGLQWTYTISAGDTPTYMIIREMQQAIDLACITGGTWAEGES